MSDPRRPTEVKEFPRQPQTEEEAPLDMWQLLSIIMAFAGMMMKVNPSDMNLFSSALA